MRVAYARGYRMVEFDAKLSRDNKVILMHDDTLERTTNGSGRVAELPWSALAQLDAGSWHSPTYAGERIPTLKDVATFLIPAGIAANIEIKPCQGREEETGARVALAARELWQGTAMPPLLTSFSETALQAAQAAAPELARGLLAEAPPENWRERLAELGCAAFDLRHDCITPELAAAVKAAGYRLVTYTVNDPAGAAALLSWGVDCIITDAIDRITSEL